MNMWTNPQSNKTFKSFQATALIAYQILSLSRASISDSSSATVASIPSVPLTSPPPHLQMYCPHPFLPSISFLAHAQVWLHSLSGMWSGGSTVLFHLTSALQGFKEGPWPHIKRGLEHHGILWMNIFLAKTTRNSWHAKSITFLFAHGIPSQRFTR